MARNELKLILSIMNVTRFARNDLTVTPTPPLKSGDVKCLAIIEPVLKAVGAAKLRKMPERIEARSDDLSVFVFRATESGVGLGGGAAGERTLCRVWTKSFVGRPPYYPSHKLDTSGIPVRSASS
jgi:hypothetical protein